MKTFRASTSLFIVAVVLWGCPYKSDVGIDDGPSIKIDKALLGVWHKAGYPADSTELIFIKNSANEYKLSAVIKSEDDEYETHFYKAWLSPVNKWQLITLYDTESKKYSFGEIEIADKQLSLKLLSEDITEEQFTTVTDMKKFIEYIYKDKRVLYDNDIDLTELIKAK